LTKTHVEAPTGFSIFLSGFLVKSAIYGFYRFSNLLGGHMDILIGGVICFLGVLDASIKMWHQGDLKKLVAYGTVQEMNLIYLAFCFGDSFFLLGGVFFCITHAFLSGLFFYLVDCVHRRYNTRSVAEISGILHTTPNLGIVILFGVILYSGFPGTLKFVSELYIFLGLLESCFFSCIILLYGANFLGILGFSKC
jgi:formate hydrogenlyase subunit 3/multisubunit Na+/H+ antiporter MnhD subunit